MMMMDKGGRGMRRPKLIWLVAPVLVAGLAIGAWTVFARATEQLDYAPVLQGDGSLVTAFFAAPNGESVPVTRAIDNPAATDTPLWAAVSALTASPPAGSRLDGPLPAGATLRRIAHLRREAADGTACAVAELDFRADATTGRIVAADPRIAESLARTVAWQSPSDAVRVLIDGRPLSGAIGAVTGLALADYRQATRWYPLRIGRRTWLHPVRASVGQAPTAADGQSLLTLLTGDYVASVLPRGWRLATVTETKQDEITIRLQGGQRHPGTPADARLILGADALALTIRSVSQAPIRVEAGDGTLINAYHGRLWPNPEQEQ
jgi:hypothetical protein